MAICASSSHLELQAQTTAARVVAAVGTWLLGVPTLENNPKQRLA